MSDLYFIHSINEVEHNGNYLIHHGILGQKWGVRRYQNPDGTLTEAGKARIEGYKEKADKYKQKVPNHYFTSIGEHKAKKYTRKAIAMEGKAAKIKRASEKAQEKFLKKEVKNARKELEEAYNNTIKSEEFDKLENRLATQTYKQTGGLKNWNMPIKDFIKKAKDPSSNIYIWDEDDDIYYFANNKGFKEWKEANRKLTEAEKKYNDIKRR